MFKNVSKFKKIFIICSLIIFLVIGITVIRISLQPERERSIASPPSETEEAGSKISPKEDILNWKTYGYRNTAEAYGYEIRYPRDFIIKESSYGIKFIPPEYQEIKEYQPHSSTFMSIHIEKINPKESLENWIKEHWHLKEFKEFEISPEENPGWIDCIKRVTIGKDIQGYMVHLWRQAWGECHYYVRHKNIVIDIVGGRIGLDWSSCSDDSTFNQMLSAFRFID